MLTGTSSQFQRDIYLSYSLNQLLLLFTGYALHMVLKVNQLGFFSKLRSQKTEIFALSTNIRLRQDMLFLVNCANNSGPNENLA